MKDVFTKKSGFTLAEILITLGIIGVVAAFTIPTLMNSNNNSEQVTALKKFYMTTNQALMQMTIDYGTPGNLAGTGLFASSGTSDLTLGNALVKQFKVAKNCTTQTDQGCWPDDTYYYYDGSNPSSKYQYDMHSAYKFITTDGMSFSVSNYKNDCITDGSGTSTDYSTGRRGNMSQTCGLIRIDTNGLKGPNFFGRDTFVFFITNGKGAILYPLGGADDAYNAAAIGDYWWKSSNPNRCSSGDKYGIYCAGRIMEESWQMNY